jgi:hypothetical protein
MRCHLLRSVQRRLEICFLRFIEARKRARIIVDCGDMSPL